MVRTRVKRQIMKKYWTNKEEHLAFIETMQIPVTIFKERYSGAYILEFRDDTSTYNGEFKLLASKRKEIKKNTLEGEIMPTMNNSNWEAKCSRKRISIVNSNYWAN